VCASALHARHAVQTSLRSFSSPTLTSEQLARCPNAQVEKGEVDVIVALTEGLVLKIAQGSDMRLLGTYVASPLCWAVSTAGPKSVRDFHTLLHLLSLFLSFSSFPHVVCLPCVHSYPTRHRLSLRVPPIHSRTPFCALLNLVHLRRVRWTGTLHTRSKRLRHLLWIAPALCSRRHTLSSVTKSATALTHTHAVALLSFNCACTALPCTAARGQDQEPG
jgi:hypothetical protein